MTANEKIQNALQQAKADSQADLEDIDAGNLQVELDALKERVRQRREADVARFGEAKEQYDNTLAVFVDEPDTGEIGLN
jgi:hypothetical protein